MSLQRLQRRQFVSAGLAAAGLACGPPPPPPPPRRYTVGITTNTRGGWETDVWKSFREAHEVGYRNVESFIHYFVDYWEKPQELRKRVEDMGLAFVTISNGSPLEMHFEDPSKHAKIIDDHARLGRFIRHLGCKHLKINLGPRRPKGTTSDDLKRMSDVLNKMAAKLGEEGLRLAPHAHMWSQFENQAEIDYVMDNTDPRSVFFVLDTGHITLAGINPVELASKLGHRILEFHMKDTKPEWKGGAQTRLDRPDMMNDPPFFHLGYGGVDFPALKALLDKTEWQGFWTVELDSSPTLGPKESARRSYTYLKQSLNLHANTFEPRT